jgi:heme-degrading monooxygenase HmoA
MALLVEMDRHVSLFEQMEEQVGSVILINTFTVELEEADQLQEAWASDAAFMKQQPGFISTQLHRGIGGSSVFVNYAIWETVDDFKRAFTNPEFQAKMKD